QPDPERASRAIGRGLRGKDIDPDLDVGPARIAAQLHAAGVRSVRDLVLELRDEPSEPTLQSLAAKREIELDVRASVRSTALGERPGKLDEKRRGIRPLKSKRSHIEPVVLEARSRLDVADRQVSDRERAPFDDAFDRERV